MSYESNKKWRGNNPEVWNKNKKTNYANSRPKSPLRSPWSEEDIQFILTSTLTDREQGLKLNKSVQAIQVKRAKVKKERGLL